MRLSISAVCAALLLGPCTDKVLETGVLIKGQATGLDPEGVICFWRMKVQKGMCF